MSRIYSPPNSAPQVLVTDQLSIGVRSFNFTLTISFSLFSFSFFCGSCFFYVHGHFLHRLFPWAANLNSNLKIPVVWKDWLSVNSIQFIILSFKRVFTPLISIAICSIVVHIEKLRCCVLSKMQEFQHQILVDFTSAMHIFVHARGVLEWLLQSLMEIY